MLLKDVSLLDGSAMEELLPKGDKLPRLVEAGADVPLIRSSIDSFSFNSLSTGAEFFFEVSPDSSIVRPRWRSGE